VALDLSPGLIADVLAGDHLGLRLFAADSNLSYLCNSRTFTSSSNRPALIITAVPEPASLALGFVGLTMFPLRDFIASGRVRDHSI